MIKNESKKTFQDRIVSTVPYPATNKLTLNDIFDKKQNPRVKLIRDHFYKEGRLEISAALKIINEATVLLKQEKNLIEINQPVVIVGDIHGQYYDLLKVFEIGGDPKFINYLFLGDYVDRGHFSIEVVLYLYSLKILYPTKLTFLRGNHECKHLTDHFSFKRECLIKYSLEVYDACIKSFCVLPLCAVVNKQLFCVHGGISPELDKINNLNKINRDREPPNTGLLCDLLWSDPAQDFNDDKSLSQEPFSVNLNRGCSYFYNYNSVVNFLKNNDLLCIIRAHEAQDNGFRLYKTIEKTKFPSVITLFSAPNYLDVYNNKAAVIIYEKDTMNTKQFSASPHPYWLPNFMDVFTWSLPFVAEKITELLLFIVKMNIEQVFDRKEIIRAKLSAISRLVRLYSKVRVRSESLIHLKGIAPSSITHLNSLVQSVSNDSDLVDNSLLGNEFKIRKKLSIEEIKELDKLNECMPKSDIK